MHIKEKWHWQRFFSEYFHFPVSINSPMLHTNLNLPSTLSNLSNWFQEIISLISGSGLADTFLHWTMHWSQECRVQSNIQVSLINRNGNKGYFNTKYTGWTCFLFTYIYSIMCSQDNIHIKRWGLSVHPHTLLDYWRRRKSEERKLYERAATQRVWCKHTEWFFLTEWMSDSWTIQQQHC